MRVTTTQFVPGEGWRRPLDCALDSDATLVLGFGCASGAADAGLSDLIRAFPRATIAACSTAGEVLGNAISDGTLVVGIARFEAIRLRAAYARVPSAGASRTAGASLARELFEPELRAVLLLCDGLTVNASELLQGVNSALPRDVVVTGGLAGDGQRFQRTWVLAEGEPRCGSASAVGLYGERVGVGHGSKGGWDIFGVERVVTRSDGNVVYEFDGEPALALYRRYLGERAAGLPATALLFPLGLRSDDADDPLLVRSVLGVSEANGTLVFAGDVPQGSRVQMMHANFDRLIEGASEAGRLTSLRSRIAGPSLSVAISCVARRMVLGDRSEEEIEAAFDALPVGTDLIGFYSYGEISPCRTGRCDLHNQTMTLTNIWES